MVHCPDCDIKINKPVHTTQYKCLNVEVYECPSCGNVHSFERRLFKRERSEIPTPTTDKIPQRIQNLSSKALKCYRDAIAAKCFHLHDLAGVALRMALEALVLDYLINVKKFPEAEIKSKSLKARTDLLESNFYHHICAKIIRVYGNNVVHIDKELPPLSLQEAFDTYENLCLLIDNELSTLEINERVDAYLNKNRQGKAK